MRRHATPDSELTPAMIRVAQALAAGAPDHEAARAGGVSRATLYRWRALAEFEAALNVYRRDLARASRASRREAARRISEQAMATLEALLGSSETPPAVRLRAVEVALERFQPHPPPELGPIDPVTLAEHWSRPDEADVLASLGLGGAVTHKPPLTEGESAFLVRLLDLEDNAVEGSRVGELPPARMPAPR